MALPVGWEHLPGYFSIGTMLLLAGFLLWLDFQRRAYRAFAAFLVVRATTLLLGFLRAGAPTPEAYVIWQNMFPYVIIPTVPLLLYFVSIYPKPRGFGRLKHSGWLTLLVIGLAELAYIFDHGLFVRFESGGSLGDFAGAGPGYVYTSFGPLVLFQALLYPTIAFAAWLLIRDARREPIASARFSLLLVAAGLLLTNLFQTALPLLDLRSINDGAQPFPWMPFGWAYAVLPASAFFLSLACLIPIVAAARDPNDQMLRGESLRILWVAPLPVLSALLLEFWGPEFSALDHPFALFVLGVWRSALPVLASYGLLRYQLFGIDQQILTSIRHGTVVAAFGAVLFLVSEGVEFFVGAKLGTTMALASAALLTFAIQPLERAGKKFAHRLMPSVKPIEELDDRGRRKLYDAQFAMAIQDGSLTKSEREMLVKLQRRLGLDMDPKPARGIRGGAEHPRPKVLR